MGDEKVKISQKPMIISVLTAVAALGTAATGYFEHMSSKASTKQDIALQEVWVEDLQAEITADHANMTKARYEATLDRSKLTEKLKYLELRIQTLERRSRVRPPQQVQAIEPMLPEPPPAPKAKPDADDPRVKRALSRKKW